MRLTISSKANQRFITDLAQRWGMTDKETLDYILTCTRLNGFSTEVPKCESSDLPEVQPPLRFYEELAAEEFTEEFTEEPDPVIERFIALGIEQF